MTSTKERNSSIELLRIIAEIGVIYLHFNNAGIGGGFTSVIEGTINYYFLFFTEGLFICAVNLFILISGYYLIETNKRRLSKIFKLIIEVVLINIIFYLIDVGSGVVEFKSSSFVFCFFPTNYFVVLYSVLYLISPYFNKLLMLLNKKQTQRMLFILFFLFSICSYLSDFLSFYGVSNALSTISINGSIGGYNIVNFVLMYFIGAYLNNYKIKIKKKTSCLLIVITLVTICFASLKYRSMWNYNCPFVILITVFIFLLFNNFNFKNTLINELSKASFTCFLINSFILKKLFNISYSFFNNNVIVLFIYEFIIALLIFILSFILYKIYEIIYSNCLLKLIKRIDNIDIYFFD